MIKHAENKPAALYLRRSTNRQEQSVTDQRVEILRYARENGFEPVAEYVDDAVSGTNADDRAAFLRLIKDASRTDCTFRHILVYDIKRFSREDLDEAFHYRYLLRQNGVEVHYIAEGFTGSDSDGMVRAMKQYLAREESRNLSRVTIRGQVSALKAGWWIGGMPPYGFDLEYVDRSGVVLHRLRYLDSGEKQVFDPGGQLMRTLAFGRRLPKGDGDKARLVLSSPDRVRLVQEMFEMYLRGMGFKAIAATLNERGIPSPKNGNWCKRTRAGWSLSTVRSILLNPVYKNKRTWNRRTGGKLNRISGERAVSSERLGKRRFRPNAESDHVTAPSGFGIVEPDVWDAAHRIRATRNEAHVGDAYRGGRAKTSEHLLSGLVRCSRCRHSCGGSSTPKGKRRADGTRVVTRYYVCDGYRTKGTHVCQKLQVPAVPLEHDVIAHVEQRVVDFMQDGGDQVLRDALAIAAKRWLAQNATDPKAVVERLGVIKADVKRLLASITPVNAKYIDEEIVALEHEREALQGQLEQIRVWKATAPDVVRAVDEIIAQLRDFQAVFQEGTPEEKKEFIRLFVEGIELDAEKRVAVCRIKKFPAPSDLDTGKLSFGLVAGVRDEQQKIVFPPVDIVEIPLVARGRVLVPAAAA